MEGFLWYASAAGHRLELGVERLSAAARNGLKPSPEQLLKFLIGASVIYLIDSLDSAFQLFVRQL